MKKNINQEYCTNCREEIAKDSIFCERCGKKLGKASLEVSSFVNRQVFYSRDWSKSGFHFFSIPNYDILIDKEHLYLIGFPKMYYGTISTLIGLGLFNLLGLLAGWYIGTSLERKKREKIRSHWISFDNQLITEEHKSNYVLKMPLTNLKSNLIVKKKNIKINDGTKVIILKGKKENVNRLLRYLEKY